MCQENELAGKHSKDTAYARTLREKMAGSRQSRFVGGKISGLKSYYTIISAYRKSLLGMEKWHSGSESLLCRTEELSSDSKCGHTNLQH